MAGNVGSGEFQIGPSLTGFQQKLRAGLARISASKDVTVTPDFTRANAEIRAWTNLPRRDIKIGVKVQDRELQLFQQRFTRVEQVYTRSSLSKGVRVVVAVTGASLLPLLAQGALSAAAALTQLGQAALLLPGLFAGAAAAIGTMLTGLGGLGAAFKASSSTAKESAKAQKDYAKASKDVEKANRDMRKAIRDARREIEDQGQALRDVWLDQEQAAINVQRAIEALKEPADSYTDYRQRVLDLNRALSDQTRTNREATRTANDATETLKGGVTQTDTFRDALENLTTATEALVKAQNDAKGMGSEFVEAMARLSPAAQDFVNKVRSIGGAWKELQNSVSDKLLNGVGDAIVRLANQRLPQLQAGMERVAGSLNGIFKDVIGNIGENANSDRISKIFDNVADALNRARPGIDAFLDAFIHLSEVGSRFLPRLGDAFTKVMQRFEAFVNRADSDGSLERWIDQGLHVIGQLGSALLSIGSILNSITEAYQEATGNIGGFADTAANGLGKLADYLKSPNGRKALVDYIKQGKEFLGSIRDAVPGILAAFATFADAARQFAQIAFPIFAKIGEFMENNAALVGLFIKGWLALRVLKPFWVGWTKGWGLLERSAARYQARLEAIRYSQEFMRTAPGQAKVLQDRAGRADVLAQRAVDKDNAVNQKLKAAEDKLKAANGAVDSTKTALLAAGSSRGVSTDPAKGRSVEMRNYKAALADVAAAQKDVDKYTKQSDKTIRASNSAVSQANTAHSVLNSHLRDMERATATLAGPSGSVGKLTDKIGRGFGKAASGLVGAVGSLTAGLGTAAIVGTALYALTAWQEVNSEAADKVQRHKDAINELKGALDSLSGYANEDTKKKITEALSAPVNAATGAQYDSTLPALAAGGVDTAKLVDAIARGDKGAVNQLTQPLREQAFNEFQNINTDQGILGALKGDYSVPGATKELIFNALAGDQNAVKAYTDKANEFGIGSPALQSFFDKMGVGPDVQDLADIQASLPEALRRKFEALQTVTDQVNTIPKSQNDFRQEAYATYGGASLNDRGKALFGPNADVIAGAGGSASIVVPQSLLDSNPQLAADIEANGGTVKPNLPGGKAQIDLLGDRAPLYVNRTQFAGGGGVRGAGTGTSDSIPAWLSNGEYVLNSKATAHWGPGLLDWMNNAPKFEGGGLIDLFPGIPPVAPKPPSTGILSGGTPVSNGPLPGTGYTPPKPAPRPPSYDLDPINSNKNSPRLGWWASDAPIPTHPKLGSLGADMPKTRSSYDLNPIASGAAALGLPPIQRVQGPGIGRATRPFGYADQYLGRLGLPFGPKKPTVDYNKMYPKPHLSSSGVPHLPKAPGSGVPSISAGPGGARTTPGVVPPFTGVGASHGDRSSRPGPMIAPAPVAGGPVLPGAPVSTANINPRFQGVYAGLKPNTAKALTAISTAFPGIQTIGGVRSDPLKWHPNGLALDIMIPGQGGNNDPTTPEGLAYGNQIMDFIRQNADALGVDLSATLWQIPDHYNHVHLATKDDGSVATGDVMLPGGVQIPGVSMAPVFDPATGQIGVPGQPGQQVLPPGGGGPGGIGMSNGQLNGPFGPLPVQPDDLFKNIGDIFIQAIASVFGIDLSGIFSIIQQITGGLKDVNLGGGAAGYSPNQYEQGYTSGQPYPVTPEAIGPSSLGSLTDKSGREDIAYAILSEAMNRGYTRDQAVAVLSTAMQESGLNPTIPGGGGAWLGIFQQDSSYPGRLDPNQNIGEFFNRLGSKGGAQGDIWKNIFWLQQRPGEKSADSAFANGRQNYLSEIQSQYAAANELATTLGFRDGGHIRGPGGPRSDVIPAMLSNGEYVLNAKATKYWGIDTLHAMNARGFANGGVASAASQVWQPLPPETVNQVGSAVGTGLGGVLAPKGGGGGGDARAGAQAGFSAAQDQAARSQLQAAPATNDHLNPAFRAGIEGGFNTIGALAGTAAALGLSATGPGAAASGAASQAVSAGFQMAGKVASGAANVLSSLLVGTVTPASTGQGYGQAMLPQQQPNRQFQSIHNGDVYTQNMNEYTRTQERMAAQRAAGWVNRY